MPSSDLPPKPHALPPLTIKDCLREACTSFLNHKEHHRESLELAEVRFEAEHILSFVLHRERSYFFTWPDKQLSSTEFTTFAKLWQRRCLGEPLAYILGVTEFWSLPIKVNTSTLIPRADTECLVERVLTEHPSQTSLSVLDLGTGTGAIALALASERPEWRIVGLDKTADAVTLAKSNGCANKLPQVEFIQSTWFENVTSRFDIIVSNPPYIADDDEHLATLQYEPLSALTAPQNGFGDFDHILNNAANFLLPKGKLYFEHGWQQGPALQTRMQKAGFVAVRTYEDFGGNPRLTRGVLA